MAKSPKPQPAPIAVVLTRLPDFEINGFLNTLSKPFEISTVL